MCLKYLRSWNPAEFREINCEGLATTRDVASVDNEHNVGTDFTLNVERGQMFAAETRGIVYIRTYLTRRREYQ